MPVLENVKIRFVRLHPDRPSSTFNKANPTWELQIYTHDAEQAKAIKAENVNMKLSVYPPEHEEAGTPILDEDGQKTWTCVLRKRSIDSKGKPATAPTLIDGNLKDLDPNSIGNGSVANIQIFQYEYEDATTKKTKIGTQLQGVQIVEHVVYHFKPNEDAFKKTDMKVIDNGDGSNEGNADDSDNDFTPTPTVTKTMAVPKSKVTVDTDNDSVY